LTDLDIYEPIALWARGDTDLLTQPLAHRIANVGVRAAAEFVTGLARRVHAIFPRAA
jgi:hypothetical protein